MRILVIGDLEGHFPKNLKSFIKKKKIDVIISPGDFANIDEARKLIYKYWGKKWTEYVDKKKAEKISQKSFNSGLKVLKKLNSLGAPIYIVFGNTDFHGLETGEPYKSRVEIGRIYEDEIKIMRNIKLVHKKNIKLGKYTLVGHGGYVDITLYIKENVLNEGKEKKKRRLKRYKNDEKGVKKLFRKKMKNIIFLTHYPPVGAFDMIKNKKSPLDGKSAGFKPYTDVDKKYKPLFHICGHMHEYWGIRKIGKTVVINPGYGVKNRAVVIDSGKVRKVRL